MVPAFVKYLISIIAFRFAATGGFWRSASGRKMASKLRKSPQPPGDPIEAPIGVEQAEKLVKLTARRIQQLVAEGWIKKDGRGRYVILAVANGYIDYLLDEHRRAAKSASASRVQDARAKEIELRTAREEGRLVDMEEAEASFADVLGTFRGELAGLPAAVTRDLALRAEIEKAVNGALDRARAAFDEKAALLRAGEGGVLDDAEGVA